MRAPLLLTASSLFASAPNDLYTKHGDEIPLKMNVNWYEMKAHGRCEHPVTTKKQCKNAAIQMGVPHVHSVTDQKTPKCFKEFDHARNTFILRYNPRGHIHKNCTHHDQCVCQCSLNSMGKWVLSGRDETCDESCFRHEGRCWKAAMRAHNSQVDTPHKLGALIKKMGGECKTFTSEFGHNPDVPVYQESLGMCFFSDKHRSTESYSCDVIPLSGDHDLKRRLCWCEELTHGWQGECPVTYVPPQMVTYTSTATTTETATATTTTITTTLTTTTVTTTTVTTTTVTTTTTNEADAFTAAVEKMMELPPSMLTDEHLTDRVLRAALERQGLKPRRDPLLVDELRTKVMVLRSEIVEEEDDQAARLKMLVWLVPLLLVLLLLGLAAWALRDAQRQRECQRNIPCFPREETESGVPLMFSVQTHAANALHSERTLLPDGDADPAADSDAEIVKKFREKVVQEAAEQNVLLVLVSTEAMISAQILALVMAARGGESGGSLDGAVAAAARDFVKGAVINSFKQKVAVKAAIEQVEVPVHALTDDEILQLCRDEDSHVGAAATKYVASFQAVETVESRQSFRMSKEEFEEAPVASVTDLPLDKRPKLKIKVGSKVECRLGKNWEPGVVIRHWHEATRKGVKTYVPYGVKLDNGEHCCSPIDNDSCIRLLKPM